MMYYINDSTRERICRDIKNRKMSNKYRQDLTYFITHFKCIYDEAEDLDAYFLEKLLSEPDATNILLSIWQFSKMYTPTAITKFVFVEKSIDLMVFHNKLFNEYRQGLWENGCLVLPDDKSNFNVFIGYKENRITVIFSLSQSGTQ